MNAVRSLTVAVRCSVLAVSSPHRTATIRGGPATDGFRLGMGLSRRRARISVGAMILAAAMNPDALGGAPEAMVRLRRGDPDALGAIISQYQHRLYRYLLRLTKNPATADDLFQQTWVRVMEKIGRFDAARNFEPWLFSIARNLAMDHFRTQPTEPLDGKEAAGKTSCASGALHQLLDFERSAML